MGSLIPSEQSRCNAGDALLKRAATRARVLRCESRDCGGPELAARTLGVQHGLETLGLRAGDRVLLALRDTKMLHCFLANQPGAVRPGSSGKPVPDYEARIAAATGAYRLTGRWRTWRWPSTRRAP